MSSSTAGPGQTRVAGPAGRAASEPMAARPAWTGPAAVGLLATLLALVNVTRVSMWFDESATISIATRSWTDLQRVTGNVDVVHALYNVLLHPWLAVAGVSELSLRLPSALATGLTAAGVVVLVRRLATPQAALAAGLVCTVLPRVTWMGIEGRSYALTAAVAVWLTVLLLDLLARPTWLRHLAYALLAAFGGALNIFVVLLLAAHGLALLVQLRFRPRRVFWTWLGAGVAGLLGTIPVLLAAIGQSGQIGDARLGISGYLRQIVINQWFLGGTPTLYLAGGAGVVEAPGPGWWKYAAVLLAAACWLLVAYALLRPARNDGEVPIGARTLLICWIVVPTGLLIGYSLVATPLYNPRYLTFCAPAVAALIGIGVTRLAGPGRRRWWPVAGGLALLLLVVPIYTSQRTAYAKSGADWQRVARFVADHPGPARAVYFAPRVPPVEGRVTETARTAQVLYPQAFAGLRDLTETTTPAAAADLYGRSQLIEQSADRLDGIRTVFAIHRIDYPADLVAADEAVLTRQGFRPSDSWTGPLNRVVVYTR